MPMKIINLLVGILTLITMNSCAQAPVDLSKLQLNEATQTLIKDLSNVNAGKMFDRDDMVSYGIAGSHFTFNGYVPNRVELLSYQGTVAGYAFRISSMEEQNKIEALLNEKYKITSVSKTKSITVYYYKNANLVIELRTITKAQFDEGMFGYLDVKRADFYKVYEELLK